jgi:hypothetical protein
MLRRACAGLVAAVLAGCSCASTPLDSGVDAGADVGDAFSFHGCVWSPPPRVSVCDHAERPACAAWAAGLVSGSDLEAYVLCVRADTDAGTAVACMAASTELADGGVACGDGPACAEGSACARGPSGGAPSCVVCVR